MLTPEYLQGLPDELVKLYEELEHELIDDICRRLKKAENITDTAVYQTIILEELGASEAYIKEKISKCSDQSEELCEKLIRSAAKTLSESYGATYAAAQKEFTPYEKNEYLQQLVSAQIEQTDGELRNMTNSLGFSYRGGNGQIGFHSAAETYRDCLDTAYTAVLTGAMDYITAVRTATKKLTDSGLKTIDYASGVSTSADVAVRRALLTGIHQTTAKVAEHNMRELNTDIVEVSAHSDSRPSHAEWQGKWYSFSGTSEDYPSLREVTKYGEPSGLLGPNCRHSFHPVIVGVDEPSYTDEDLEKMKNPDTYFTDADGKTYTLYEAEQRKRYMERKIRATKKELLAAQETGDIDKFTAKSVLLKRQKAEYERFCQASKQLVENERTQYTGFGKSISQKAVWAAKKAEAAKAKKSSSKSSTSGESSSGHSVEVDVPAGEVLGNTSKTYTDEKVLDNLTDSGIIEDSIKDKPITIITEQAIEKVPCVKIDGYTDEQCKFIQEQHKELLRYSHENNEDKEVAFAFDSTLTKKNIAIGSDKDDDLNRAVYGLGMNITVLHNHPRNGSYSDRDVKFLATHESVKTITIVKNNGKVETLTKSPTYSYEKFDVELKRALKKCVKHGKGEEITKAVSKIISEKELFIWSRR